MANEKLLIDANVLLDEFLKQYTERERNGNLVFAACEIKQDFADMISKVPNVDAVEVVRCRDCEHYKWIPNFGRLMCTNFRGLAIAKPDDFCSYGERRKND